MEMHIVEMGKGAFALELAISEWGRIRDKIWLQKVVNACKRGTLTKEFCMWSKFSQVGLNEVNTFY